MNTSRLLRSLYVFLILLSVLTATSTYSACGGVERWAIKVGNDPAAQNIDVSNLDGAKNLSPKEANNIPDPRAQIKKKDNSSRLPEEHNLYRVMGRLVFYKHEGGSTGDSDYHLVITDDSRKYTNGGTKTKPTKTSFIAEIPDPNCFSGRDGDLPKKSAFDDLIRAVRESFETRFPDLDSEKESINVPVILTGLAFFDKDHGQIGRALNGFELHPVLNIEFVDQPQGVGLLAKKPSIAPLQNLLKNPGFEEEGAGWLASDGVIRIDGYPHALSGVGQAVLGGTGIKTSTTLSQRIKLPADATSITLSFRMRVRSEEPVGARQARDLLHIQIRDTAGKTLKTLATYSNLDVGPRYRKHNFDLTNFRGRNINLRLIALEDGRNATSFAIDDVELTAN